MNDSPSSNNDLQNELNYYKKKLDELSGESISYDYAISSLRFELKQKKEAFSVLSKVQTEFTIATPDPVIFEKTLKAINTHLGMDRSLVLILSQNGAFKPGYWDNLPEEQIPLLKEHEIRMFDSILTPGQYILLNRSIKPDETALKIRQLFSFNYFIGVPVFYDSRPTAFLLAGRQFEKVPFYQPLNKADAETLMSIASLIGMTLQNKKMVELRAEMIKQQEENSLINKMLAELKATQAQLIQSEKMASLGELTAGIAHEIQNPLNFVNNFSEVNGELISELVDEVAKGNSEEAKAIAEDIKQNLEKINHHGRRADAIVKGMLLHSRASAGEKEPTNINKLADEYLRLSYHGLRAKDKSFNAVPMEMGIKTEFDESIGKINIIPQDIGRVLLNLFNNAFYAVNEKAKLSVISYQQKAESSELRADYKPFVSVQTKKINDKVGIIVTDNGNGIPQTIVDKIFQPFFTTKPVGQGTGLGLSLAYDIIKAHGGEIRVDSKEGYGSEFSIILPTHKNHPA